MGWLDENTLSIQFADNTTDKIFLSPANNIPGLIVPCVFSGALGRDLESVVSVTGCKDSNVIVSIASDKLLGGLIDLALSADGETSKIVSHLERAEEDAPSKKSSSNRKAKRPRKNGSRVQGKTHTRGQDLQELKTYCQEGDPPGVNYAGYMNVSKSGKPCRVWRDKELKPQQRHGIELHNFCRNPSDDSKGVYCITERGSNQRWEYCSVPICGGTR